ncbi:MAG: twin-arginine translocase TatA/TatE family subunit [Leptospirales bacterium]|nr:twin-arginine translocase TatA/TatE family subunit [Leptospirales bacterium]
MGWLIIIVVALLLFGGRRIPQLAKDLGSGIREFRQGLMNSSQTTTQVIEHQPQSRLEDEAEEPAPKKRAPKKAAKKKARA